MITEKERKYVVYDLESNGLLHDATKIHCLSACWLENGEMKVSSTTSYEKMRKFFLDDKIVRVGHNIALYDERVAAKLLNIKTNKNIIDTLALSWYLYPEKIKHSLEEWGKDLGLKKVEIKDWSNLTSEEYVIRCEQDTRINMKLYELLVRDLNGIYNSVLESSKLISYLNFKLDCVREQEEEKIRLDIPHVTTTLDKLKAEKASKEETLKLIMPKMPIKGSKTEKRTVIVDGQAVVEKIKMEVIKGYRDGNPNSVQQKKAWLDSLGWEPDHYKYVKEDNGKMRKIPQISNKEGDGICISIKKLFVIEPKLEVLEGLSVLSHRIGLMEGFLKNQRNGYLEASMAGFTNTLRLKHVNIVNLPTVKKTLGPEVRASLIAEEGELLCGSDMSSLEDSTKQHYIYFYDRQYVTELRTPGFDSHFDIAVLSGLLTADQVEDHKSGKVDHSTSRQKAKVVNFASVYGAGPAKIALTAGISLTEAKILHRIYWERNKAVKQIAESCTVKEINGKKWLYNPVSHFWYSLRAEKDRFSTLNQGTGVYCFDSYVKHVRERGIKISVQMHDEILFKVKKDQIESIKEKLNLAIKKVNEEVKLNIPLGISVDFGQNYADCH